MTEIYTRPPIPPMHELPSAFNQRLVDTPYSPGRVQKCDSSPFHDYSHHQQERSTLKPRSPMPDYNRRAFEAEAPASKGGHTYQTRPETSQNPPREPLPPISSFFGSSTTHQNSLAQSPFSDRHSPVYPAVSPLDSRLPVAPVHPDRPYNGTYFQRTGASRQSSSISGLDRAERPDFAAPSRPAQPAARPESPRYESRYSPTEAPRTQPSTSVNAWSPRSQPSRPEYFARDTSSSFRPHLEHHPHPPQNHRHEPESRPAYRDAPLSAPVTPNYPPTPASTIGGDAAMTKDGLGPKIWTGTQFLPRFVRQAEVPGEGICYFYDDGTHCKTVIDGEPVNAHWGVTKAGKPRKRLAIACITCREKKIKCDPDYPRCLQCEKFGRVCRFKNAPRGGQGSPDTPPADLEDALPRPVSSRTDIEPFKSEKHENSEPVSPRRTSGRATPDSGSHHSKRQRNGYNDLTPLGSEASPRPSVQEVASPPNPWVETLVARSIDHSLLRDWQVNPYTTRPALVVELLSLFFKQTPESLHALFPEGPFKSWVLCGKEKSLDDLMVIYATLAIGTIFSPNSEHKALGVRFASISRYACDTRHFSIQLVHTRNILSLYYFSINKTNDALDFCAAALSAANVMKLNLELEKTDDVYLKTFPYGLNRHGYAECRRRAFWSCYILDHFNSLCSKHISAVHTEDIFLRLPCDSNSFELQADIQTPYFDLTIPTIQNDNLNMEPLRYMIGLTSIWGDVMANIYRTAQSPAPATSNAAFAIFYPQEMQRLRAWQDSLPLSCQFSAENLKKAASLGKLAGYVTMHAIYHSTGMYLNRYIQRSTLSPSQLAHHVSVARHHAESLLMLTDAVAAQCISPSSSLHHSENGSTGTSRFSAPLLGYSILSAVDILTAKISLRSLTGRLDSFNGAQAVLAELALFWRSAKGQHALVRQRLRDLAELTQGRDEQGGTGPMRVKFGSNRTVGREIGDGMFEMSEAMEPAFSRDYDCVYA